MNLTTLELDTIYFYFIKLGHFIPTGTSLVGHVFTGTSWSSGVGHVFFLVPAGVIGHLFTDTGQVFY